MEESSTDGPSFSISRQSPFRRSKSTLSSAFPNSLWTIFAQSRLEQVII